VEEEAAGGRRGVDRLVEHDEVHPECLELPNHRHRVVDAPVQAVELHARDDVERAATDGRVEGGQGRPLLLGARDAVVDELGDHPAADLGLYQRTVTV
jgi:hypothetical protein